MTASLLLWSSPPQILGLCHNDVHSCRVNGEARLFHGRTLEHIHAVYERTRAERVFFMRAGTHRGPLRVMLSSYLATNPRILQFCSSWYGKPTAGRESGRDTCPSFNVSHSHAAALYTSTCDCALRIDLEHIRIDVVCQLMVKHFFSPNGGACFDQFFHPFNQKLFSILDLSRSRNARGLCLSFALFISELVESIRCKLKSCSDSVHKGAIIMKQISIPELDLELSRLDAEYRRRDSSDVLADRYSLFNESALLHSQSLERIQLTLLKRHGFTNLTEKRILDVGCGSGSHLRRFLEYGAQPTHLFGIDLMEHRIEEAQRLQPTINWQVGSAHQLPYPDASFDLVMSFVVFSSILNQSLRQKIVEEMWRVRKPSGYILFYDFAYSNPHNPAVRGISCKEIQQLFKRPRSRFDFRRITLAPPISRRVAPHGYWLAYTMEQLKFLNTHIIGLISLED